MQKSLDGPRYTVGVFQKKSVAGLFNQTNLDIRQQGQQLGGRFGRQRRGHSGAA